MVRKTKEEECNEFITAKYSGKQVMDKLELMHTDIKNLESQVKLTNGKVKFHSKVLWSFGTTLLGIIAAVVVALITNRLSL
jgi:hypothetical protein